jgi:hypothetical protein
MVDGRRQAVRWNGRLSVATRFAGALRTLPVRIATG